MGEYVVRLALSCRNTHVVPGKSDLTQPTFFKSLLGSKERTAKNERRVIRLFQSEPYLSSGRPSSLNFEQVYESEVLYDAPNVNPSLVAEVKCPEDTNFDRKIRLYVYYSSNLTSGKEILLAGTSFELRDLLRTPGLYCPKGEMFSDHCNNARANVLVLNEISPIFTNNDFSFVSSSKAKNPLEKQYIFYSPSDTTNNHGYPAVHAQEITVEPRLSTQVSLAFLQSMKSEVRRSSKAWKERYLLERMRQGKFKTTAEAFVNGWQEVAVTVKGSNLDFSEDQAPSRSSIVTSRDSHSRISIIDSPVQAKMKAQEGSDSSTIAENMDRGVSSVLRASGVVFREAISSYYNVCIQSHDKVFCRNMGNTNVEYMTNEPIYGSNVNAHVVSKADTEFQPSGSSWISHEDIEYMGTHIEIKGETTLQSPINIRGKATSMHVYVPQRTACTVGLKLYVDMKGRVKSHFSNVGVCIIPLVDYLTSSEWTRSYDQKNSSVQICTREFWAPVQIQDTRFGDGDARVLVSVSVKTPVKDECKFPAPYSLTDFCLQDLSNLESCRSLIDNYESTTNVGIASLPDGCEGMKIMNEIDSAEILAACYDWMHVCGCLYQDPLIITSSGEEDNIGVSSSITVRMKRLDAPYSVTWLESHIHNIDTLIMSLEDSINECIDRCKSNVTFRCSADKTKKNIQGCATNLHAQIFSCNNFRVDDISGDVVEGHGVISFLTCGAPTTHALKTNRGGVSNIERAIDTKLKEISILQEKISSSCYSTGSVDILSSINGLSLENDQGDLDNLELLKKVQHLAMDVEQDFIDVSLRRIYSLSQVLSTVLNGLIMKLNMVVEGHIEHKMAKEWVEHGLLVIFEGLLSATGKERTMLEDAYAVIETLRLFKVKIVTAEEKLQGNDRDTTTSKLDEVGENMVSVDVTRREARLYIPCRTLSRLPPEYSAKCEISLCTILFTQGIDIKQSMATAYSGESAVRDMNTAEIQKYFNNKSLEVLNAYCNRKHPVQQPTNSSPIAPTGSHPTLEALRRTIHNTSPLEKDVRMLLEVEQVGHLLGGLRVTFCKSGKDRTGMAITLEQARFIGNTYNCGSSDDVLHKNASIMRLYGTRLALCEKNIGRAVYSINSLQAQFLPQMYRPPPTVLESLLKTGKDTS